MMEQYMNETVGVKLPDGQCVTRYVPVKYTEDDIAVATRMARHFPSGSIVTVDGVKFKILSQDPPEVKELLKKGGRPEIPPPPPAPSSGDELEVPPKSEKREVEVQVGQRWVTKDPRRKQEPFEVMKIEGDSVVTDKGVRIGIHRLNRYKLVG